MTVIEVIILLIKKNRNSEILIFFNLRLNLPLHNTFITRKTIQRKDVMTMKKKPIYAITYGALLAGYTAFALLDAFVIPHDTVTLQEVVTSNVSENEETGSSSKSKGVSMIKHGAYNVYAAGREDEDDTEAVTEAADEAEDKTEEVATDEAADKATDDTVTGVAGGIVTETDDGWLYKSENVTIEITKTYVDSTYVYIADIQLSDTALLKSGLAEGTFGRNITEKTSKIASEVNAILAINGDYYGFRSSGYVMRSGYLYRDSSQGADQEDLVMYSDGTMDIISEGDVTAEELAANGAVEIYSFGPGLVEDGEIAVSTNYEVGHSMNSNPRTAIGYYEPGHYCFVVSDGRTSESEGLSLYQLAELMDDLGVEEAYNLDGGGSSTMYFNGQVINNPTTNGNKISERSVSDIIYIPMQDR